MTENQFNIVDVQKNSIILKNFATYIFKDHMIYLGKQNRIIFFGNDLIRKIALQQQFKLNGQMKITKKWKFDFKNLAFMNQSNYFVAQTAYEIQIWKIDKSYNISFVNLLQHLRSEDHNLLINKNDNLIVTSNCVFIYFIINSENENQNVQQKIKIGDRYNTLIEGYQLNDEGNILILLISSLAQQKLLVILRTDGKWEIIKEIMEYQTIYSFCFLDNDKFIIFIDDCKEEILSIWQVFIETMVVKRIHKQKFDRLYLMRSIKQRNLLIAQQKQYLFLIKWNNNNFFIQQKKMIQKELELADIINEDLIILHPSVSNNFIEVRSTPCYTIQLLKLY